MNTCGLNYCLLVYQPQSHLLISFEQTLLWYYISNMLPLFKHNLHLKQVELYAIIYSSPNSLSKDSKS